MDFHAFQSHLAACKVVTEDTSCLEAFNFSVSVYILPRVKCSG
jgi:hypothetical protein